MFSLPHINIEYLLFIAKIKYAMPHQFCTKTFAVCLKISNINLCLAAYSCAFLQPRATDRSSTTEPINMQT